MVSRAETGTTPERVVELLYFDGCPHYEALLARLRGLIHGTGRRVRIELRCIPDDAGAVDARFLGSPTVRVDGCDVEPGASERDDYGMRCRLYVTDEGPRTTPPDLWMLDALSRPTRIGKEP